MKSFEPITEQDLRELVKLALIEHEDFFKRKPDYELFYKNSLLFILLGQGAALHYRYGEYGVKDFDIYLFYKDNPEKKMWVRRVKKVDSNLEKFGNPKIDFMKKVVKLKYIDNENAVENIIFKLLKESKSFVKYLTVFALKEKDRKRNVVIGLYPESIFKKILWDGEVQEFV